MSNSTLTPDSPLPIRVLAADRNRMSSQLLVEALSQDRQLTIIETEPRTNSVLAASAAEKPDIVLLSAELEGDSALGLQVARQLRAAHPSIRVIMLLNASERAPVLEAFRAGARGVFCRTESLTSLAKCIHCVHTGQVWANSRELGYLADAVSASRSLSLAPPEGSKKLSKREQDVVRSVVEGLSNREIARHLNLTEHTVKNYLLRIFDKLGVSNRVGVVLYAFSLGQTPGASRPMAQNTQEGPTQKPHNAPRHAARTRSN